MFLIPPVSSGKQYRIQRSLRFNSADSAYLSRTPSSSTNTKTFTFSCWSKIINNNVLTVFSARLNDSNRCEIAFDSNANLRFNSSVSGSLATSIITSMVFRDFSAHRNIVVAVDTTQATESDRVKIYVDGIQITALGTANYPSLNEDFQFNSNVAHAIGRLEFSSPTNYYRGYLSEIHFIDGLALSPSSFGRTDPSTGVWIPKKYVGSYGTNGFYLDFSDNSSTSALGTDRSGNGNDFTANNLSVTAGAGNDSLVDVPTNFGTDSGTGGEMRGNYCTWNPNDCDNPTLTNGNLDLATTTTRFSFTRATFGIRPNTGKYYWEITINTSGAGHRIGISADTHSRTTFLSDTTDGWAYLSPDGNKSNDHGGSPGSEAYGNSYTNGDIIGVAYDSDTGSLWFSKNGTWQASGDPAAGTNYAYTGISSMVFPSYSDNSTSSSSSISVNFGQRAFSNTAPSGFKVLCSQNLPNVSVKKGSSGFVAVTDTESNIIATLAAARSGWTSYVDIIKNRDASENWYWRFSHDSSNEYVIGLSNSYQSVGALSGSNDWVGYSIKTDGPARAGSVSHTNGSDTTVTHNAGNSRALILLFPRSGSDVLLHNPELTSGQLLVLNSSNGPTTSDDIKNFGTNSFQIDASMSSGTYDYLVIPESEGFFKLGKYTGNGSANGPCVFMALIPKCALIKKLASEDMFVVDQAINPTNVVSTYLSTNSAATEQSLNSMDLLSSGLKVITTSAAVNTNGSDYVYAAFAESAFKYSRAG